MLTELLAITLFLGSLQQGSAGCDVASLTTVSGIHAPQGKICPGDLIFEDTFDKFDLKKWQHELTLTGGGNKEFEWYLNNRTNSYTEDGILHIRPTLLSEETGEDFLTSGTLDINGGSPAAECTNSAENGCSRTGTADHIINPLKSARIRTVYSFSFTYGKVEVRPKHLLVTGYGQSVFIVAIWMMPRWNQYSGWPVSGEIDIMESRGNRELYSATGLNIGTQQIRSTLHWGPNGNYNRFPCTNFRVNNRYGYNTDFHNYQLDWTPDSITFSVDNGTIGTVTPPEGGFWELGELEGTRLQNPWKGGSKMAPFDDEFYLIINLAIGGVNYFPENTINKNGDKPWRDDSSRAAADFWENREQWLPTWNLDTDDSHFQVDYVKIWAL